MSKLIPTEHAVTRFMERFAGNLSFPSAARRLTQLAARARFRRVLPGGARLYTLGDLNLVVAEGAVVTVYRLHYRDAPARDLDPWHVPAA